MIPELGQFALILALCLAIVQSIFPLIGAGTNNIRWMALGTPTARAQFACLSVALACLTIAFIQIDFSVAYVAHNANSALPLQYRISAVWGAHEGSLLLWVFILSGWTLAVTFFTKNLPPHFAARVLAVLGFVSVGFLLFLILTSNPFERLLPAVAEGRDLNPLLQDPGLIIHPPMLYMGYVGLALPFAFAIAALLSGRIDAAWTRWTRPWTLVAWVFLTLGITLGSWWAYYELGWGGWWFWDPVENASFMPWLVATALLHSLAVTEQRSAFKAWTLLLAIFGFSLSLLGTFLVRSGVLVSVHAFASDPARGVFILAFLVIVIGGALSLYAWRSSSILSVGRFTLFSRETLLLLNNILLVICCGIILFGTVYPIIHSAMGWGSLSVGKPYFDFFFVLSMLPLVLLLGIGPLAKWKQDHWQALGLRIYKTFVLSLLLGLALILVFLGPATSVMVTLSLLLATWVIAASLNSLKARISYKDIPGSLRRLPMGYIGMLLAHIGVGIFIVGVTVVSTYEIEKDVRLGAGSEHTIADYRMVFKGVNEVEGPNYRAQRGTIEVYRDDKRVTVLQPEKRFYLSQGNPMTEAAIDAGLFRDLYVSLGEPLDNGDWAVRLYYKPFVRWLWLGPLFMAIGGLIAATDRRYRKLKPAQS